MLGPRRRLYGRCYWFCVIIEIAFWAVSASKGATDSAAVEVVKFSAETYAVALVRLRRQTVQLKLSYAACRPYVWLTLRFSGPAQLNPGGT